MMAAASRRKHVNSAAERNKEPILQVLREYIIPPEDDSSEQMQRLLEISSGSGQHTAHLAPHFPWVIFQPSEVEDSSLMSIAAYVQEFGLTNVKAPIYIDITQPFKMWDGGRITEDSQDYMLNINMIHITPYACTENLFKNAGTILKPGGYLFTYGPYAFDGNISPESNVRFDAGLRNQNPEWGLRDVAVLTLLAEEYNMALEKTHALPANNHLLVWRKQ